MSGPEERVFGRLPDETWIYPGHGNDTTLGAERPDLLPRNGSGLWNHELPHAGTDVLICVGVAYPTARRP